MLLGMMSIKLKDEKKNYRSLVNQRQDMGKLLRKECENKQKKYLTTMRKLRKEVKDRKEVLQEKYRKKFEHLSEIRRKEEDKRKYKVEVPEEIEIFKDCIIFNEEKFSGLKCAEINKSTIGDR